MKHIQRISDNQYLVSITPEVWTETIENANEVNVIEAKETFGKYKVRQVSKPINPEIGKQFFNLDNNCICYFNGSDWKKVISENL